MLCCKILEELGQEGHQASGEHQMSPNKQSNALPVTGSWCPAASVRLDLHLRRIQLLLEVRVGCLPLLQGRLQLCCPPYQLIPLRFVLLQLFLRLLQPSRPSMKLQGLSSGTSNLKILKIARQDC